ncbi:MAG: cupredoxin domain-containing protein, partial [Candidatus Daviesbacteria bacterium]|nr:cupredoxin domain-containing protein [Candidatus Daviesbacteria bacterium]
LFNISNGLNLSGLKNGISLPVEANAKTSTINGDAQVLKTTYTSTADIQPNTFTVKAGQPVRMEVDVQDDGSGCMGSFAIPGLSSKVEMLNKGNTLVYEFTPESTGTYNITCAMGVPRGSITVI